ncbi:MAG TPA: hypothetical protein VEH80_10855 [Candidatus Bathyarchaeia archaeon]|nr:hypothetical protein [Candidatus Bathyarchaeia archaeon]
MDIKGWAHLTQHKDLSYSLTCAPLGVPCTDHPRHFTNRRELEYYLAGPLQVDRREIQNTITMLDRNGQYSILEVSLPPAELARLAA